ncbi:hypothetical protein RUM44_002073 [Polyplax serrata]|uniref:Uncharacterized protein n=1 Tax=Polyplax serrata TaxID=468196 RepID=A0ABR1ALZ0_POLSC
MIFISSEGNQKADGGGSGTCATANRLKNRKVKEIEEEVAKEEEEEEEKEFPVLSLNQCKCLRIEDLRAKRIEKEKDFLDYGDASHSELSSKNHKFLFWSTGEWDEKEDKRRQTEKVRWETRREPREGTRDLPTSSGIDQETSIEEGKSTVKFKRGKKRRNRRKQNGRRK